jgi:hypothetical protein
LEQKLFETKAAEKRPMQYSRGLMVFLIIKQRGTNAAEFF